MSWDEDFKIIFYSWLRAWKDDHLKNPRFIKVDIDEPLRSGGKISIRIVPYPDLDLTGISFVEDIFEDKDIKSLTSDDNSMLMKMFKIDNYKDFLCLIMMIAILKRDWSFKDDANKWLFNAADSKKSYFTPIYRISDLIYEWHKILAQYWEYYREGETGKGLWGYFVILAFSYYRIEALSHMSGVTSFEHIPPKWFDFIPFDEVLIRQPTELPDTPTLREINRLSREYGEFKRNWPACRYHKEHGDRTFHTPEELEKAGPGWFDSPTKVKEQIEREEKEKQLKEKQRKEGIINLKDQYPECYELIALMEDRGESLELIKKACKAKGKQIDVEVHNKNTQDAPEPKEMVPDCIFRYTPETCILRYEGSEVVKIINPTEGFFYISLLLGRPRKLIQGIELRSILSEYKRSEGDNFKEVITSKSACQYGLSDSREQIVEHQINSKNIADLKKQEQELKKEIADADNETEKDMLYRTLLRITEQLYPNDPKIKHAKAIELERARKSVGRAIGTAMKEISKRCPPLFRHLHNSIRPNAINLSYSPIDVEVPPTWIVY